MALNQEQKELQRELKMRADAFVSLCEELPKDIVAVWYKLVGYIREYCYMDEEWDGKEMTFCSEGKSLFKMVLTPDAVVASFMNKNEDSKIMELRSMESVEQIIATIKTKQFLNVYCQAMMLGFLPAGDVVIYVCITANPHKTGQAHRNGAGFFKILRRWRQSQ